MGNRELDYNEYIEIADGVYWVGFADKNAGFHCNPYLITDHGEAVLIDSGSRNDFSTVMLKIMRTGTDLGKIKRLIYQHYDPDLCGNIPHMEALINNKELKILSHKENNIFIDYYSTKTSKECIEDLGFVYRFSSGRELHFIRTPFAHSAGSFVTYDTKTKVLFSSDLFGSYDANWSLYSLIIGKCGDCTPQNSCPVTEKPCQITNIWKFHKSVMPSTKALRFALKQIAGLDISIIAPQHGSLLHTPAIQKIVIDRLNAFDGIGIDQFLGENEI
ncbi:MAG: MBL fold metallo-hydrolase [Oscillospiraceae bacterium]|nr:MBL fold metallo-hydrolase [Oscillospiraceae bacterium]